MWSKNSGRWLKPIFGIAMRLQLISRIGSLQLNIAFKMKNLFESI
jgi:hypothetical protein